MRSAIDPRTVLDFWFADTARDPARADGARSFWFEASDAVDAQVRERFGDAIEAAARGDLAHWVNEPLPALALVVLLDQFPRNVWRGSARAFAHDPHAREVARAAIAAGHLDRLAPIEQAFLILPYQHDESLASQRESVKLAEQISRSAPPAWRPLLDHYADFARQHLALIERFGDSPTATACSGARRRPTSRPTWKGAARRSASPRVSRARVPHMAARIFFALTALIWLPYGIYCFFQPGFLAEIAGVTATTTTATIELQAMYGGLQAGIGAFALAVALQPARIRSALFASCFLFAGLAIARLLAALSAGEMSSYTVMGLGLEWGSTAIALALLRRQPA